ncbi:hypothetical protein GY45DRAFT_1393621 [Cubamyces sp. BRFM 1775]|nr:hypothetical protein GY45DRAFT_1393621 [Cubamyces sp. BRFM 1775]
MPLLHHRAATPRRAKPFFEFVHRAPPRPAYPHSWTLSCPHPVIRSRFPCIYDNQSFVSASLPTLSRSCFRFLIGSARGLRARVPLYHTVPPPLPHPPPAVSCRLASCTYLFSLLYDMPSPLRPSFGPGSSTGNCFLSITKLASASVCAARICFIPTQSFGMVTQVSLRVIVEWRLGSRLKPRQMRLTMSGPSGCNVCSSPSGSAVSCPSIC